MTGWRDVDEKGYLSSWLPMTRDDDRPVSGFHGSFIPAVIESLVLRLTEPGDYVWDPMAGSGTSLPVCADLDRNCLQGDLSVARFNIYEEDARTARPQEYCGRPAFLHPKCQDLHDDFLFDLIVLHPPYHSIIKFSDSPADLSNCNSITEFLEGFSEVCRNIGRHLKPGGYIGLAIGDVWITRKQSAQTGDSYGCYPLGFKCTEAVMDSIPNTVLTAVQVKNIEGHARHRGKSTNLWKSRFHSWGSVSFDHEYLFSIRKEK